MKKFHLYSLIYILLCTLVILTSCYGQSPAKDAAGGISFTDTPKAEKINKLISTYAEYGDFNGAVLVAKEGKILYHKGFGLAEMEWKVPNTTNTKFRIGSITKQFTAMLVVQLAAENKLDLHASISTYLPDYPKENGERITAHQLLTHSSGTPNNYEHTKEEKIRPDAYSTTDLIDEFAALPLEFTPGEKFDYSNAGYNLLAHLIETITGKKYEEILQDRIFNPLGMKGIGFDKHRAIIKNRASGYFSSFGTYYNANYIDMSTVYAAGALYATVEDIFLWDQALYTEKLVPEKYLELIFTPHISDPDYGGHYGYGWSIKDKPVGNSSDHVQTISHDGVIDGFCAIFTRIPSSKTSIILLSNVRRAPLNAMTKGVMGILYEKSYDFPKKSLAYSLLQVTDSDGIAKGIRHFEAEKNNPNYYLNEEEINVVSYKLLQSDRAEAALEVLKLGIAAYPEAFNLYDSYGEVLRGLGKTSEAIENYKKSVQLNPDNENGWRMLREMGVEVEKVKE
ncbi:serine hydrolase domain-containing protein [Neolewinella persica]|uniref:serine hydrolase domain-containing protein n=1 Tax=Neolewinella persica TaxID=70998 RepID=UPI00037CAB16|nr:serine hydrolase domain-containing protein [Neolewinella persica]